MAHYRSQICHTGGCFGRSAPHQCAPLPRTPPFCTQIDRPGDLGAWHMCGSDMVMKQLSYPKIRSATTQEVGRIQAACQPWHIHCINWHTGRKGAQDHSSWYDALPLFCFFLYIMHNVRRARWRWDMDPCCVQAIVTRVDSMHHYGMN